MNHLQAVLTVMGTMLVFLAIGTACLLLAMTTHWAWLGHVIFFIPLDALPVATMHDLLGVYPAARNGYENLLFAVTACALEWSALGLTVGILVAWRNAARGAER